MYHDIETQCRTVQHLPALICMNTEITPDCNSAHWLILCTETWQPNAASSQIHTRLWRKWRKVGKGRRNLHHLQLLVRPRVCTVDSCVFKWRKKKQNHATFMLIVVLLPCHTLVDAELPPLSERETDLQELRKFDLDWQFGPCTGKGVLHLHAYFCKKEVFDHEHKSRNPISGSVPSLY